MSMRLVSVASDENPDAQQGPISVLIIGAGPAGLVNARTLLQDEFSVTIVAKEDGVGGCWRNTYPDLTTNAPWGAFTFPGLDMPKPSSLEGKVVPARAYRRYLEEFYHYFVEGKVEMHLSTEVISLTPTANASRGWTARLAREGDGETRAFDRVVLATGYLGKPLIPLLFRQSPIPTFHTADLANSAQLSRLLEVLPSSPASPVPQGDEETVLVVGGGKSGMDLAALLTNRGRKVVWTFRGPLKWFAPVVPPGMMGANRMDIYFGPSRTIDSWAMWFYHRTWLGALMIRLFWKMMRLGWSTVYSEKMPAPTTDPYLSLAQFAGGIPTESTDFQPLLAAGRIASVPNITPIAVEDDGVVFESSNAHKEKLKIKCGAIVLATGYNGANYDFIDGATRQSLGLDTESPDKGSKDRIKAFRDRWRSITAGKEIGEEKEIKLPLVLRGILPFGRWTQRDLAVTGATRSYAIPAISYEVESHWISSMFNDDPCMRLPVTESDCLAEIHAENDFIRARYPGIVPHDQIPSSTYFTGFNDLAHTRTLLRDLMLNPWRQKSDKKWWQFWKIGDWLDR
nr:uncharacterized protein CI109_006541 [Kwoniella shandongensis]KAA5525171.1 hypothetical protein CI109_006541 [Kwoniella shandongensis]